jgi:hypothetical protein
MKQRRSILVARADWSSKGKKSIIIEEEACPHKTAVALQFAGGHQNLVVLVCLERRFIEEEDEMLEWLLAIDLWRAKIRRTLLGT